MVATYVDQRRSAFSGSVVGDVVAVEPAGVHLAMAHGEVRFLRYENLDKAVRRWDMPIRKRKVKREAKPVVAKPELKTTPKTSAPRVKVESLPREVVVSDTARLKAKGLIPSIGKAQG